MAEGVGREEIARLDGREVLDANGESVGYVDVMFADDGTGEPEWLGVWNGVWHTKPRVLVPVEGIRMEGDRVRVPWTKDQIEGAPSYDEEDNRGLFSDDPDALGISRDKGAHRVRALRVHRARGSRRIRRSPSRVARRDDVRRRPLRP
jgi:hypothetical protein